ncbi:MAG: diguanylate cyclase [Alphaproteobacteria bacterium]
MVNPSKLFDEPVRDIAVDARLDARALLVAYPGPAVLLDGDGRPSLANAEALELAEAWGEGATGGARDCALRVIETQVAAQLALGWHGATLDVVMVPTGERAPAVLVLGRDVGPGHGLRDALVESRQRYKDFAACVGDFLWETGPDGSFIFVSPAGALGYRAGVLVGRDPATLLDPAHRRPLIDPFRTDLPVTDQELHLITADGSLACVLASALPVFGAGGGPRGARGVWRDVTIERSREAELIRLRRREHAVAQVVGAMRDEPDIGSMLDGAAVALAEATGADFIALYAIEDGDVRAAAAAGEVPPWLASVTAAHLGPGIEDGLRGLVGEGFEILLVATRSRGRVNGALCMGRRAGHGSADEERAIVVGVADAVGLTIEQVRGHESIRRLSRLDALTGLLNRRAFREEIARRGALAQRRDSATSVFYIDLDHFKQVNDGAGHAAGDAALKAVADLLLTRFRSADVVARLGGDEFAVWCDDMDEPHARAKAEEIGVASGSLGVHSPSGAKPLGLSIGVASRSGHEASDIDTLLAAADAALYAAKNAGRGRHVHSSDGARDETEREGRSSC